MKVCKKCGVEKPRGDYYFVDVKRWPGCLRGECKKCSIVVRRNRVLEAPEAQLGMSWENWGRGPGKWQVDHIIPLVYFDLTNREQFLKACHYTNLQPLWHEDHVNKSTLEDRSRRRLACPVTV